MKLFVTVGAQMPFDRLVLAIDAWAVAHPEHQVLAQIGQSELRPTCIRAAHFLSASDFERAYDEADAVIGHAGIGTLFAAMERGKPIVVLPREAARRETRNDHQIATARRFQSVAGVVVAWTELDLPGALDRALALEGEATLAHEAQGTLIEAIASFIDE